MKHRVRGGSAPQKRGDGREGDAGLEWAAGVEGSFCEPVAPRSRWEGDARPVELRALADHSAGLRTGGPGGAIPAT